MWVFNPTDEELKRFNEIASSSDEKPVEPPEKKTKVSEESPPIEHDIVGDQVSAAGEPAVMIYPPQYTVFPALKDKNFTAQCVGVDGKAMKISSLKEGMEVVSISDCTLEVRNGLVYPSLTGQRFAVKQLDAALHCQIASEMLVP
jgi:hypothetical protein